MYMTLAEKIIKTCSLNVEKLCTPGIHYHTSSYDVSATKYPTFYKVFILQEIIFNLTCEFWKTIFNINAINIIKMCN